MKKYSNRMHTLRKRQLTPNPSFLVKMKLGRTMRKWSIFRITILTTDLRFFFLFFIFPFSSGQILIFFSDNRPQNSTHIVSKGDNLHQMSVPIMCKNETKNYPNRKVHPSRGNKSRRDEEQTVGKTTKTKTKN